MSKSYMRHDLQAWAWNLEIDTNYKFLAVALSELMDQDGECHPSDATLMRMTQMDWMELRDALLSLREAGVIQIIPRNSGLTDRYIAVPYKSYLL